MSKNKSNQSKSRQKYSPQCKDQAVERAAIEGVPQVANDLGIKDSILYYWRAQKITKRHIPIENQKLQQAEYKERLR